MKLEFTPAEFWMTNELTAGQAAVAARIANERLEQMLDERGVIVSSESQNPKGVSYPFDWYLGVGRRSNLVGVLVNIQEVRREEPQG